MTSIEVKTLLMGHQTACKLFVNKEVEIDILMQDKAKNIHNIQTSHHLKILNNRSEI